MPDYTKNYNLAKPLKSEKFKTATQNENLDKIDQELKNVNDRVDEVEKAITTQDKEIKDTFAKLQEDINGMSTDEVKKQMQSLDHTVTAIDKNIKQIGDKTEEIDREVAKLQEDIKQIEGADVIEIGEQIQNLNHSVAELKGTFTESQLTELGIDPTLAHAFTLIQEIQTVLQSEDTDLDTIQEFVDYVKANREDITLILTNYVAKSKIYSGMDSTSEEFVASAKAIHTLKGLIDSMSHGVSSLDSKLEEMQKTINSLPTAQGSGDVSELQKQIGDLQALKTTDKNNLVSATNEVLSSVTSMKDSINELVGDVGLLADLINRKVV